MGAHYRPIAHPLSTPYLEEASHFRAILQGKFCEHISLGRGVSRKARSEDLSKGCDVPFRCRLSLLPTHRWNSLPTPRRFSVPSIGFGTGLASGNRRSTSVCTARR